MTSETIEKPEATNVEHQTTTRLVYTEEDVKRVVRKLDWHILPFCFLLYTFSVLDRGNLGNAKLAGLYDELHLTGDEYDWLGTM